MGVSKTLLKTIFSWPWFLFLKKEPPLILKPPFNGSLFLPYHSFWLFALGGMESSLGLIMLHHRTLERSCPQPLRPRKLLLHHVMTERAPWRPQMTRSLKSRLSKCHRSQMFRSWKLTNSSSLFISMIHLIFVYTHIYIYTIYILIYAFPSKGQVGYLFLLDAIRL